jgi:hypothetical protein
MFGGVHKATAERTAAPGSSGSKSASERINIRIEL